MQYKKLNDYFPLVLELMGRELPAKLSLFLAYRFQRLNEQWELFSKERQKLVEKYVEREDPVKPDDWAEGDELPEGRMKMKKMDGGRVTYQIRKGEAEVFDAQMDELLSVEMPEAAADPFPVQELLTSTQLKPAEIVALVELGIVSGDEG